MGAATGTSTASGSSGEAAVGIDIFHGFSFAGTPGSMTKYWEELQSRLANGSAGVVIEDLQEADERGLLPRIQAADAAQNGPVLVTYFSGWNTYLFLSQGVLEPLDEYVGGEEETSNWIGVRQFDGAHYLAPFLSAGAVLFGNRSLLQEADVEYDGRFESWEAFMTACQSVKELDVTPIALGAADGLAQDKWAIASVMEVLGQRSTIPRVATGDVPVTDPAASIWAERLAQLVTDDLISSDAADLTEQQSIASFLEGEQAFILTYPGAILGAENADEFDLIGFWKGSGPFSAPGAVAASGMQMRSYGEQKEAAGRFLKFQHDPDQLQLFNEMTGELPSDRRFDPSGLSELSQRMWSLILGESEDEPDPIWVHEDVSGTQLVAIWDAARAVIAGGTPDEGRALLDARLKEYREQNPGEIEVLAEYAQTFGD